MTVRAKFGIVFAAVAMLLGGVRAGAAKTAGPVVSIPLDSIGFQPIAAHYLLAGDTMYTLHFVDDQHLLVTFTTHGLIKRMADSEPLDYDRNVQAVLLELPSGKVLGRTEWHLRDHGQYLWPIGHGRFLLRIRNRLSLLSPMLNLAKDKPFQEEPFVTTERHIGHISVSPMNDLLTIETIPKPVEKATGAAAAMASLAAAQGRPMELQKRDAPDVQIAFFRFFVEPGKDHEEKLVAQSSGLVRARDLIEIAATSEGYLDVSQESPGVYDFDFQPHGGGKKLELSPYDSTCIPRARFISASEFVAFGCRGTEDKQQLSGFNLKGEQNWIDAFPTRHVFPYVVPAPATGRFALSRTLVAGTYVDPDNLTADMVSATEITVLQSHDGRTLLKTQAAPIQKAGQNFDLSPDGTELTVVRADAIEVYKLPALSKKDEQQIKLAGEYAPARNTARIDLGARRVAVEAEGPKETRSEKVEAKEKVVAPEGDLGAKPQAAAEALPAQTASETGKVAPASAQQQRVIMNGDEVYEPETMGHRKKPSLYDAEHPKGND
ncbi:hypothetical protein [Granulicella tundricola]|uniref:Uncharacterized protein n=1 Tax=Granulicella tundricola (strain ATCC BAA-1859 / DSM 23138 / MP5ACTX9) TaxID=1198114 RepID=E8WZM5_GRATM|nr:hypothetical protein [Granulicella tundricola]ADW69999.1 hypothetical protein AciX9_2976 [Granulicella tundricola MP5ACTX9]